MTQNFKNVLFAVTGNFRSIEDEPASGMGWPALLVASVALGIAFPTFGLIAINQAVLCVFFAVISMIAPKSSQSLNFRRLCIVLVAAPLPSYLALLLDAPRVLVLVHMGLVSYWASRAAWCLPPAPQQLVSGRDQFDLRSLRASAATLFVEVGPVVAYFQGAEVPAWFVDARGRRHVFVATCADPSRIHLAEGETIVPPGLIYGLEQPVS